MTEIEAAGSLSVNGRQVPLTAARLTIGRAPENDLVLDDALVSRHHAVVEGDADGGLRITDLASGNGTYIGSRLLRNGSTGDQQGSQKHGSERSSVHVGPNILLTAARHVKNKMP